MCVYDVPLKSESVRVPTQLLYKKVNIEGNIDKLLLTTFCDS